MRCRRAGITGAGEPGEAAGRGARRVLSVRDRHSGQKQGLQAGVGLQGPARAQASGSGVADRTQASRPSAFLRYHCSAQHRAAAAQIAGRATVRRQTVMTRSSDGARARSARAPLPICAVRSLPAVHARGPEAGAALWCTRAGRHGGGRAHVEPFLPRVARALVSLALPCRRPVSSGLLHSPSGCSSKF